MASLFDSVAAQLAESTGFSELIARGILRAGLEDAGLDPIEVTPAHMKVMVARVLPEELSSRGVENAPRICQALAAKIATLVGHDQSTASPDDFFDRLNRRT